MKKYAEQKAPKEVPNKKTPHDHHPEKGPIIEPPKTLLKRYCK